VFFYFFLRWGREPFLAVSVTDGGAEAQQELKELKSLCPPPCISLIETLLENSKKEVEA